MNSCDLEGKAVPVPLIIMLSFAYFTFHGMDRIGEVSVTESCSVFCSQILKNTFSKMILLLDY